MSTTRSRSPRAPATRKRAAGKSKRTVKAPAAALLLVAHGSEKERGAALALARQARRIAATRLFSEVRSATLKGGADPAVVLARMAGPLVFVVPHLMSHGYLTRVVIPRMLKLTGPLTLRRNAKTGLTQRICYCEPVGTNLGLAGIMRERLLAACRTAALDPRTVTALVVGHGTTKDPASRRATERQAEALAGLSPFASVECAFLDEEPRLAWALARLRAHSTVVTGLFAAEGLHGGRDIPAMIAAENARRRKAKRKAQPTIYAGAAGADPRIATLILQQVRDFDEGLGRRGASSARSGRIRR